MLLLKRLLIVIFCLSLFAGCGKKEDEGVVEIKFYTMQLRPTFDDYFFGLISEFEQTHPGVKITWMDQPGANYETKLITSFIGKNDPDVLNLATDMVLNFARAGFIEELEPLVPQGTLDKFVPNLLQTGCTYQDRVYALPWYVGAVVTMCNSSIFKEAGIPITEDIQYFDNIEEICRIIAEKTDKFGYFQIYSEHALRNMLMEVEVPLVDETRTKAVFNTPEGLKVFKFWVDLYQNKLVPSECLTATHRRPIELYKTGRLAIFHSGPQFLRQVKSDAPEVYEKTLILPQMTWKGHPVYRGDMHIMAVSKHSKHPKIAAEFAAFVTNLENQLKFCKLATIFPSITEGLEDPMFTTMEDDSVESRARVIAAKEVKECIIALPPPKSGKFFDILSKTSEKVCMGKMTAEEGLADAERRVNELIKR